ncbi:MAG: hypothetical protein AB4038_06735 [Prochloraceae cyanobacterium]
MAWFRLISILCLVFLTSCNQAKQKVSDLDGVWQSNRDETMKSFEKLEWRSASQKAFFSKMLGKMILVYDEGLPVASVFEGKCQGYGKPASEAILEQSPNRLVAKSFNEFLKKDVTVVVEVKDGLLYTSLPILEDVLDTKPIYEVFSRPDLSKIQQQFPCLKDYLK